MLGAATNEPVLDIVVEPEAGRMAGGLEKSYPPGAGLLATAARSQFRWQECSSDDLWGHTLVDIKGLLDALEVGQH